MLSPTQEQCPPSRVRFWASSDGLSTFQLLVQRFARGQSVERDRAREQLILSLRASDFATPEEVEDRVYAAAHTLADRLKAEMYSLARHLKFVKEAQPHRPAVVYGEADLWKRDSLSNDINSTSGHQTHFAQYLEEQNSLSR